MDIKIVIVNCLGIIKPFQEPSYGVKYGDIHCVRYARILVFSDPILYLYMKMQVGVNPYSGIFYAVVIFIKLITINFVKNEIYSV